MIASGSGYAATANRAWNLPNADGTVALLTNKLSDLAATSSAELAGVISDETGSGSLVFGTSPVIGTATARGGITADTATATDDRLVYAVTTGGGARFDGTLSAVDLTAARAWNLPDEGGTVALTSHTHSYLPLAGGSMSGAIGYDTATASATTHIGSVAVVRVGASTGSVSLSGTSNRTGDLHVEITTSGEAGGACRFKYQFGTEALSGEKVCTGGGGIALDTTGLTAVFTNGAPLSFEDGDVFTAPISLEATSNHEIVELTADLATPLSGFDSVVWNSSTVTAGSLVSVEIAPGTATTGMPLSYGKVVAAGKVTFVAVNIDAAAPINGTVKFLAHVYSAP